MPHGAVDGLNLNLMCKAVTAWIWPKVTRSLALVMPFFLVPLSIKLDFNKRVYKGHVCVNCDM